MPHFARHSNFTCFVASRPHLVVDDSRRHHRLCVDRAHEATINVAGGRGRRRPRDKMTRTASPTKCGDSNNNKLKATDSGGRDEHSMSTADDKHEPDVQSFADDKNVKLLKLNIQKPAANANTNGSCPPTASAPLSPTPSTSSSSSLMSPPSQVVPSQADPVHDLPPELLQAGWRKFWSKREGR